jgi:hypothetical protein
LSFSEFHLSVEVMNRKTEHRCGWQHKTLISSPLRWKGRYRLP